MQEEYQGPQGPQGPPEQQLALWSDAISIPIEVDKRDRSAQYPQKGEGFLEQEGPPGLNEERGALRFPKPTSTHAREVAFPFQHALYINQKKSTHRGENMERIKGSLWLHATLCFLVAIHFLSVIRRQ